MFTKVRDSNDWWTWFDKTLLPNVRVQLWYNQAPPYRLRGYLDDRVNRLIGYAIVRQVSGDKAHHDQLWILVFPSCGLRLIF